MFRHLRRSPATPSAQRRQDRMLIGSVVLIIVAVVVHAVGGVVLVSTSIGSLVLHRPVGYGVIGVVTVIMLLKLALVLRVRGWRTRRLRRRRAGS